MISKTLIPALLIGLLPASAVAGSVPEIDLGGYYRGYVVFADQDSTPTDNHLEFRRDSEIHVTAETALDNGVTVGMHTEHKLTPVATSTLNEASLYAYGDFGRVVYGLEDGAVYTLQTAIPAADSNIDGLRAYINGINNFGPLTYGASVIPSRVDRLTYIAPRLNGFQAGISYAPRQALPTTAGLSPDALDVYEYIHEAAVNWRGEMSGVKVEASFGYLGARNASGTPPADHLVEYKSSIRFTHDLSSVGFAWQNSNNGLSNDADTDFYTVGVGYDPLPWHFGASYLFKKESSAALNDTDRFTAGIGYLAGPGISFRAAAAQGHDRSFGDNRFTQLTFGTDIQF